MRLPVNDRQSKIDLIQQWKDSGLTQKEFYQQHNIPQHVFYYWHKCYRDQQHKNDKGPLSTANGFVQITSPASAGNVEVQFSNGTHIIFNEPVSWEFLKALTR